MYTSLLPDDPGELEAFLRGVAIGNETATFAFVGCREPIVVKIDPNLKDDQACLCISPDHVLLANIHPMQISWVMEDSQRS